MQLNPLESICMKLGVIELDFNNVVVLVVDASVYFFNRLRI